MDLRVIINELYILSIAKYSKYCISLYSVFLRLTRPMVFLLQCKATSCDLEQKMGWLVFKVQPMTLTTACHSEVGAGHLSRGI